MGEWREDPITGRWTWDRDGLAERPLEEPADTDQEYSAWSRPTPYLRHRAEGDEL